MNTETPTTKRSSELLKGIIKQRGNKHTQAYVDMLSSGEIDQAQYQAIIEAGSSEFMPFPRRLAMQDKLAEFLGAETADDLASKYGGRHSAPNASAYR